MGCGIIHWNPGFCKEGQGGFVGFRALRASGRGNCVQFCGRPRGPPLRLYVGDLSETWRAGLGPAPTADKETVIPFCRGRSQTGPWEGHTPGWLLSAFGRFTFSPSPTVFKKLFRTWVGEVLGSPAGIRTSHHLLGKARRSRGIAPAAILEQPGPSGPGGNANRHSDFARRKYSSIFQVRVPRKWGPRGRRIWTRSVHPEPPPSGSLVTFWPSRKSLAARGRRNLSAHNRPNPKSAPSSVTASPCHLPPRGKA